MRTWILWIGLLATALLAAALAYGCGETSFGTCADNATCPSDAGLVDATPFEDVSADARTPTPDGEPAGGDDGPVTKVDGGEGGSGMCNASAEPKDAKCVIDEAYGGVFLAVSPKGMANGAGTKASPLNSVDAGITLALQRCRRGDSQAGLQFVVQAATTRSIAIDASRDQGVQVFGGLHCSDWSCSGEKTAIAPSAPGIPLTLSSLTDALFVDLEIDAADAPSTAPTAAGAPGASSLGVFVSGSKNVLMQRCTITAGQGQPGQDQTAAAAFSTVAPSGDPGVMLGGGRATPATPVAMAQGTSTGGSGGAPTASGEDGNDGDARLLEQGHRGHVYRQYWSGPGANGSGGGRGSGC